MWCGGVGWRSRKMGRRANAARLRGALVLLCIATTNLDSEVCLCLFLSCHELALQRELDALHCRLLGAINIRAELSEPVCRATGARTYTMGRKRDRDSGENVGRRIPGNPEVPKHPCRCHHPAQFAGLTRHVASPGVRPAKQRGGQRKPRAAGRCEAGIAF